MLSSIRHSLHNSLPSYKRRRSQHCNTETPSDSDSVKTRNDLRRLAKQWVDSSRSSNTSGSDSASRSPSVTTSGKAKANVRFNSRPDNGSPAILATSIHNTASTSSPGKGRETTRRAAAPPHSPSSTDYAASVSEGSTAASVKGKDRVPRQPALTASSPTESEASLRSLNKLNVKEGFRDRQWDKARTADRQPRDISSTRSITPISEDSVLDQEQLHTQVRRMKKASDLRSVHSQGQEQKTLQRAASTSAASTRRKQYAFPALALLADDPESYRQWIEQNSQTQGQPNKSSKAKGKEPVKPSRHRSDAEKSSTRETVERTQSGSSRHTTDYKTFTSAATISDSRPSMAFS